jgi:hypothetical protein
MHLDQVIHNTKDMIVLVLTQAIVYDDSDALNGDVLLQHSSLMKIVHQQVRHVAAPFLASELMVCIVIQLVG